MKNLVKLFIFLVSISLAFNQAYAAFPVERSNSSDQVMLSSDHVVDQSSVIVEDLQDNGKSQLVALLLCILVGTLGIHRFYLGYTGIGIIQLLTFGGLGIWTLIDLILIATGGLKPKDGEYEKTL